MVFSSTVFLFGFLPVVLLLYYTFFKNNILIKNVFLFIVSILFYAWGEPAFSLILLLSIIWNWLCASKIAKHSENVRIKKFWLVFGIVFNLAILFVFKYLHFFATNIAYFLPVAKNVPEIALPIGISFFTFQAISYIVDVYRKKKEFQKNPLFVGLYIAFFPQLIAGPIVRYETVADQIQNRKESFELFSDGVSRFIIGLGKKAVLANSFAIIADSAFKNELPGFGMAWLGAISYTFQIFFDFSGYSDMAIGLGKMFGFEFEENFNRPYLAKSISDFWRRWHISMGTWFRDYVYFPLGGSRVKRKSRMVFNLFVVWLLTGLWHGANWTFVLWGLFYFAFISFEKLTKFDAGSSHNGFFKHIYTMLLVIFGWVLFRSDSISYAISYLRRMFVFSNDLDLTWVYIRENAVIIFIAIVSCFLPTALIKKFKQKEEILYPIKLVYLIIVMIVSVSYIVKGTYNPFIYFNF